MLKGINTGGRYVEVTGGSASTYVNRSYNSSAHNQGQMMYDLDAQCIKVFDGQNWLVLSGGHATVGLTYEAQSLLDWVRIKKDEEHLRSKLIEEHPQLKQASEDLKQQQDNFELLVTLAKKFPKAETTGK
jgi:hypothetical protein